MEGGKLVRDRIPDILRSKGLDPIVTVSGESTYFELLRKKLVEEVDEFLESEEIEELADVVEVVHALARVLGSDERSLEAVRAAKESERGAFADRIVWFGNREEA